MKREQNLTVKAQRSDFVLKALTAQALDRLSETEKLRLIVTCWIVVKSKSIMARTQSDMTTT